MIDHEGEPESRRVALITGVGRPEGIGSAVARRLAQDGYDVAVTYWSPYDRRVHQRTSGSAAEAFVAELAAEGVKGVAIEADLEQPNVVPLLFDRVEASIGPVATLVLCHCESVDSGIFDTTLESFDRHFAVNARASWLLIREFGLRFPSGYGNGRVVALTSDHVVGNLAYGASKGALDRITLAAAQEFAHLGITSNVINPGPTDTGWMTPELKARILGHAPLRRLGTPEDAAHLVSFLCSREGGWINGQLLQSNGGLDSG
jgi:3-oxoacyl-[acyl-carrier protein] reductase